MTTSYKQPKNIFFINTAKTLGIFFVVLGHLPISNGLYNFINHFTMPLFFIIAGYLISTENIPFKVFFQKKFKTLIIPYFFFVGITLPFWFFVGRKFGEDASSSTDHLRNYILGALFAIPSKAYLSFNFPIWFLPSLFCSEMIFYWGRKLLRNYAIISYFILLLSGIYLTEISFYRLPFGLDISLYSVIFIQIGHWLKEKNMLDTWLVKPQWPVKLLIAVISCILTIYISQMNSGQELISLVHRTLNNYILFFAGAFSGCLCILASSNIFPQHRIFDFFGRNTIIVLGLHIFSLSIIKGIQVFILKLPLETTEGSLGANLIYTIAVFILLAPVIYLINKYAPFLLGRKKGVI